MSNNQHTPLYTALVMALAFGGNYALGSPTWLAVAAAFVAGIFFLLLVMFA